MAKTRSFGGVTESVWACVKSTSEKAHGTKYDPPNANRGTATTSTIVGDVVLGFDFDPAKETITYTIKQKPFLASDDQIWNGIQETIDECQSQK
jgi:hypothetical protein